MSEMPETDPEDMEVIPIPEDRALLILHQELRRMKDRQEEAKSDVTSQQKRLDDAIEWKIQLNTWVTEMESAIKILEDAEAKK